MDAYQGHLPDGSSVQKHSAGEIYPFVIACVDSEENGRYWSLLGPGIEGAIRTRSYEDLHEVARRLLTVRENEDAWSFELESLCRYAGQVLTVMRGARIALAEDMPSRFEDMTPAQRVSSLLYLGLVRNGMFLPETGMQKPFFSRAEKAHFRGV